MYNKKIYNILNNLLDKIKFDLNTDNKNEIQNTFRLKALLKVLDIIKNYPKKIKSSNELKGINGIGKHTLQRIDEILLTGTLAELNDIKYKSNKTIEELEQVFGIGRKTAKELIAQHNIKSIEELKSKANEINLPKAILIGLKYYDIYKQHIPRQEMMLIDKYIHKVVARIDIDLYAIMCGSYRRQKLYSNDIDILLVHPNIKTKEILINFYDNKQHYLTKFINELIQDKFIIDTLTDVNTLSKFMGFCKLPKKPLRRIDIRFMPYESFYTSLMYFTGSKEFNQYIRKIAVSLDYKLNEYGLFDLKSNKRMKINSENDIFNYLNINYIEPKDRN